MATLFVTQDTDFRGGAAETNISDIVFEATDPNTIAIIAGFEPAQFGAGLISDTVTLTGDGNTDLLQVNFSEAGGFSAAGWTFANWDDSNQVQIFGTLDNQDITGSSKRDFISGGGGVDHIDCGAGNDTIQIGSAGVAAGTTIEGGTQDAGGVDTILLVQGGTRDLTLADISGVEELFFNSTGTTAIVAGDQIGAGGFSQIFVGFGDKTVSLIARGSDVDLRGVTSFSNWGDDESITILGTSTSSNVLFGSSQDDTIQGTGNSSDLMTGGGGVDILTGGRGGDNFRYFAGNELVLGEVISGGLGADALSLFNAGAIDFRLATLGGVETLDFVSGASTATFASDLIGLGSALAFVSGSAGTDRIVVETVGQSADLSNLAFTGWSNGTDTIAINGVDLADIIHGSSQNDTIDGKGGTDTMTGGVGDDLYFVDNAGDAIVEGAGQGALDKVATNVSYALGAGVQVEVFTTTSGGGTTAIDLTGNEFAQSITGNAGANTINGKGGADTMAGGKADDLYFVDNAGDVVVEGSGQGTLDKVATNVGYTLGAGVQVEIFTTTSASGTTAIDLTGNEFGQTITGNAGANTLKGNGGNDTLNAGGGSDKLVGGVGGDTASGGLGNDVFIYVALNEVGDTIADFSSNAAGDNDVFKFDGSVFGGLPAGVIAANQFETNASGLATAATTRFIFETDARILHFDSNGIAGGGTILDIATLQPGATMTFDDIVIF